ncbi:uncharacterized protein LOC103696241 isoform X1 [Phoenix dactylifera]|uniref:Uncharacterized protein LOC103696241 isoform X1 n=1 Tax=Phoenix dactylifera TaxID=42345 RepID=A0A8B9A0B3_PHODC|nr:uncharacterized protein LOC103696241 isoform X1 [Phoenix dactylifera]
MASSHHSMEESADCSSASTMQLMLQSCQAARRRLQERVSALEDNLNYRKTLLENHQIEARTFDDGLKKCIEDKAAVAAKCAKLENEMMKLTMPCEEPAKTDVSMSTEELKNSNKEKEMIASVSIQLENLMENTRKLAAEFASFEHDLESGIINFKSAGEEVRRWECLYPFDEYRHWSTSSHIK